MAGVLGIAVARFEPGGSDGKDPFHRCTHFVLLLAGGFHGLLRNGSDVRMHAPANLFWRTSTAAGNQTVPNVIQMTPPMQLTQGGAG